MKSRIPFFCNGCPHFSTYTALTKVLKTKKEFIINGDIGCYELAGFGNNDKDDHKEMRDLIDTLYVMGSGISISQGMYHAGYKGKLIALAGDSTFFHSCIPGLINAVEHKIPLTYIIFDNRCTAMTGQQFNASNVLDIEKVVRSLNIDFVETVNSYNQKELEEVFEKSWDYKGVSVIITQGDCIQLKRRLLKLEKK